MHVPRLALDSSGLAQLSALQRHPCSASFLSLGLPRLPSGDRLSLFRKGLAEIDKAGAAVQATPRSPNVGPEQQVPSVRLGSRPDSACTLWLQSLPHPAASSLLSSLFPFFFF